MSDPYNSVDWYDTDTYWDIRQEEENRQYLASKCQVPHSDGSTCMPGWDGFGFICFDQVLRRQQEVLSETK